MKGKKIFKMKFMKILLINCPIRENANPNNVPLGIYYISSIIKKYFNVTLNIIDFNSFRPTLKENEVKDILFDYREYDIILLSGLITTFKFQKFIFEYMKSINKKIKIMSGGGLASNLEDKIFEYIDFDSICIGEGENNIRLMLNDFLSNKLKKIYHEKLISNLDDLPLPDWGNVHNIETYIQNPIWGLNANNSSNINTYNTKRSLNIITSRGCPYECKFCNKDMTGGRKYRFRNHKNVAEEIEYLYNTYNIDFIGFLDDNFAVKKERVIKIFETLKEKNINIKWGGHIRFDNADNEEFIKRLSELGCVYLGFGGESANENILNKMKKKNKPEQMKRVLYYCRKYNIHPNVTWMVGWKDETLDEIKDTIKFILNYAPENKNLFVPTAYPKTEFYDEVKTYINENFYSLDEYLNQLDDASKCIINYSNVDDTTFSKIVNYIKNGEIEKICQI